LQIVAHCPLQIVVSGAPVTHWYVPWHSHGESFGFLRVVQPPHLLTVPPSHGRGERLKAPPSCAIDVAPRPEELALFVIALPLAASSPAASVCPPVVASSPAANMPEGNGAGYPGPGPTEASDSFEKMSGGTDPPHAAARKTTTNRATSKP
jgi:hypothetical protein